MNIPIDEQIEAQDEICRLGGGPMEYAILATLERVNAAEAGLPVEPDFISEFATHAAGHKAYDIGVTPKQINELVKYIDTIRAYAVQKEAALKVAQQDRDNCYASLDAARRRLHEIEVFVSGDANDYRINEKLKDDEKSIKSLIEHLLAMAREAGFTPIKDEWVFMEMLERFHALAVAKERGECAKVAETPVSGEQDDITRQACDGIAKRIRARSAK